MNRNPLEWAILVLSIGVILAISGFLVIDAATGGGGPADVVATAAEARAVDNDAGWLVPVVVTNRGGTAARSVLVEVVGTVGGSEEVSELAVDVLAGGSEVELWAGFSARPEAPLTLRIVGLETP